MNGPARKPGPAARLPSIESQTIAFIEESRALLPRPAKPKWLRWDGFWVYLRYRKDYVCGGLLLSEAIVIANVEVPRRYQGRGWFWRYCQLCLALTDDALVVEEVLNPHLYAAIKRRPEFVEVAPALFVIRKERPGDWPLKLTGPVDRR